MSNSQLYCTAPWKGIAVMQQGNVKTCCVGSTVLGNLNNQSLDSILQSPLLDQIKQDLVNGWAHPNCKRCRYSEDTGNYANLRQHYLKFYPMDQTQDLDLKVVDVRWNNKCNLQCGYCGPESSSTWEEKLGMTKYAVNKPYQDELLAWILTRADQLKEIMLAGGETMLMKQNYKLFALAPKDSRFSIVTNLSYDLANLPCMPDLLARPRDNVIWNVSVENINEQFEYVRQGASWSQLVKNMEFLIKYWPHTVGLNMVYSVFSATTIDETYKIFSDIGVHKATLLWIEGNRHLAINRMPSKIRQLCKLKLTALSEFHQQRFGEDKDLYPINGIESIHEGLDKVPTDSLVTKSQFYDTIAWHDSWSKDKKFRDLWPDLCQLLDGHLTE